MSLALRLGAAIIRPVARGERVPTEAAFRKLRRVILEDAAKITPSGRAFSKIAIPGAADHSRMLGLEPRSLFISFVQQRLEIVEILFRG